jgi:hypothetical protein
MRLVSREQISRNIDGKNLIYNGDFSVWHSGASSPEGFHAPSDTSISYLRRIDSKGNAGRYTIDQWWRKSDSDSSYFDLFHVVVPGISSNQIYELSIHAQARDNATVSLSIIALDENDVAVSIWPDVITLSPEKKSEQRVSKKILAHHSGALAITAHSNPQTNFDKTVRIWWFEWRLTPLLADDTDAIEPEPFLP